MSGAMTAAERVLRARAAAYSLHAKGGTNTTAATAASQGRFEREVDPDGVLSPDERARRAALARKAYMTDLARRAVRARRLNQHSPDRVGGASSSPARSTAPGATR